VDAVQNGPIIHFAQEAPQVKIRQLARSLVKPALALLMLSTAATLAGAQTHDDHDHAGAMTSQKPNPRQNELVQAVRDATERFKDVRSVDGPGEGYQLMFGCVSGGDFGAMGLHYVKGSLLQDSEVKIETPEIVLFEPTANGGIRITGADYIVDAAAWDGDPKHTGPPELDGQLFHYFDAPNRFGLNPFYTLHVWAWKDNPNGTFANWNPNVSCDAFNPPPDPIR
jgi:hypothetical protein